ncbi:flagellin [Lachnospiraceae bacterium A2]|nr:flagellin [Lachnospiraceae bacterium A2]
MAMIVQHNLTAMNSNRQLGVTTNAQAKSSEKLSSSYRINRAGDDAAGLKISEKMRSQVRGLTRASTNAQDGVSLIQTAEGALNEAHSILQRMNELAVQGANDTNENIDREAINEELDALTAELDRISTTTQFNKQNLLDGSFQDKNLQVGANANQKISISIGNMNAQTLGLRSVEKNITNDPQRGTTPIKVTYQGQEMSYKVASGADLDANKAAAISKFTSGVKSKYTSANYTPQYNDNGSVYYMTLIDGKKVGTLSAAISIDQGRAVSIMTNAINNNFKDYVTTSTTEAEAVSGYSETGRVAVDSYEIANNSITAIQDAINKVSSQRSALGAIQNRLEHTIANLDNVAENTQAAESRIRDLDMASEMVEYSKNNILAQAGQSMLAQANQSTQGVLSLLG